LHDAFDSSSAPSKKGMATATFLSIFDIGIGLGSFLVGMIVAEVGFRSFYLYILAGIVVYLLLYSRKQTVVQQASQDVSA
jgi:predicted MFS family arabinose efflux permease